MLHTELMQHSFQHSSKIIHFGFCKPTSIKYTRYLDIKAQYMSYTLNVSADC